MSQHDLHRNSGTDAATRTSGVFRNQIKEIFDFCDMDNTGYILVARFVELARCYVNNEDEIQKVVQTLDPDDIGKIDLETFSLGISRIVEAHGLSMSDMVGDMNRSGRNSLVTEDDHCKISLGDASSITYNEYDISPRDEEDDQLIEGTKYMFSDVNTAITTTSTAAATTTNSNRSPVIMRKINRRMPRNMRRSSSMSKLNQDDSLSWTTNTINGIKGSYIDRLSSDSTLIHLKDKFENLHTELNSITEDRKCQGERVTRLQNESTDLKDRLIMIEERLQDMESGMLTDISLKSSCSSNIDKVIAKYQSTLDLEWRDLLSRVVEVEHELRQTKDDNQKMHHSMSLLRNRLDMLDEQLRESERLTESLKKSNDELVAKAAQQAVNEQRSIEIMDKLVRQVNGAESKFLLNGDLRHDKSEIVNQLKTEIDILKSENSRLKEHNEQLQQQVLALQVQEGYSLVNNEESWASELDMMSKDDLLGRIQELQNNNTRYHQYIERMLLAVMQKDPNILENLQT